VISLGLMSRHMANRSHGQVAVIHRSWTICSDLTSISQGSEGMRQLGIKDLYRPEFGDAPEPLAEDEIPVFWGCGVTPQQVIMSSPHVQGMVMGHAPGKMICVDLAVAAVLSS
jgi:uncharacterized protein YcsI (UPF0317 family)